MGWINGDDSPIVGGAFPNDKKVYSVEQLEAIASYTAKQIKNQEVALDLFKKHYEGDLSLLLKKHINILKICFGNSIWKKVIILSEEGKVSLSPENLNHLLCFVFQHQIEEAEDPFEVAF